MMKKKNEKRRSIEEEEEKKRRSRKSKELWLDMHYLFVSVDYGTITRCREEKGDSTIANAFEDVESAYNIIDEHLCCVISIPFELESMKKTMPKGKCLLLEEIKKVPGLTQQEWIKAAIAIMKEPNLIDLFMQAEPDMKKLIIDEVLAHGTVN
ncbi:hypothetical protein RIF29_20035 [Crotalaria pallida]|uniref:Uncharacterized protein n=1 Tax=Crotalaria pallida TaxID=3830 RepID=A0AAN9F2Q5_CROPI